MKKTLLLIFLGLITLFNQSKAQNFSFAYDTAGNRTDRTIVLLKSAISGTQNDTAHLESKEELLNDVRTVIYPNPTRDDVFVRFLNLTDDSHAEVLLYDDNGRQLKSMVNSGDEFSIGLSSFTPGNYYIHIIIDGKSSRWKVIKQ